MTELEHKNLILRECEAQGVTSDAQKAYILATVEWETNGTFKPVKEAYWLSEDWRKRHLRYYPYYGRGYVQLTWKENYNRFGKLLELDLVNAPDIVLEPEISAEILVIGMRDGLFTGKKLADYINDSLLDFVGARKIVNGIDKAHTIASMAIKRLEVTLC